MQNFLSSPFLYAGIICVAAIVAAIGSNKIANTRKAIASRIENLIGTADTTLNELKETSKVIDLSWNETEKANLKLEDNKKALIKILEKTIDAKDATIESQKDIIGQITGGDSYPRLSIGKKGFYIRIIGEYSIPNLKVDIIFLKNYLNIPYNITQAYIDNQTESEHIYKISSVKYQKLWVNSRTNLIPIENTIRESIITNNSSGFDIYFNSGFNRWVQKIRFIKHGDIDEWGVIDLLHSEKVTAKKGEYQKSSRIYLEISDKYPLYFIDPKSKDKVCRITLYNIGKQRTTNHPNFYVEYSDSICQQPFYIKEDFQLNDK